ncbi:hypothetical protein TRFO_34452 [Tritrichomonas foetus]|uniref:Uncharacterized protein n=1 Tax=Tritrichomonas foetus TaxID=1144522 RepID=A0A1J4JKK2_9EUKA|nr:hypothetical protein TRFO_34452 [Tritrichomonas foetus]|eukprot:OHS99169.1 hypothetical protein TRFO_34452 [Tritrichomonas foetus]
MLGRVVKPEETTYGNDFRHHHVDRIRSRNLSTAVTTGRHYCDTPKSLYRTDHVEMAEKHHYERPKNAKYELYKLPPDYNSTVRPNLDPNPTQTNYQQYFGRCGYTMPTKRGFATTSRQLSKTDQTDLSGTTKGTHYPPGYTGHIPREWKGNRGKQQREDRDLIDITYQYHTNKTGYCGFIPKCENTCATPRRLERTPTTYRDMCDETGFRLVE